MRLVELDLLELGVWVWRFVFPETQLLITEYSQVSLKARREVRLANYAKYDYCYYKIRGKNWQSRVSKVGYI